MTFKTVLLLLLFTTVSCIWLVQCTAPKQASIDALRLETIQEIDSFNAYLQDTLAKAVMANESSTQIQQYFVKSRLLYKKVEWAVDYFMPTTARFVNGPPLDELELEENKAEQGEGLQMMETFIYPAYNTAKKSDLLRQLKILKGSCARMKQYFTEINFADDVVIDAARLEVYRIITLGISGFDAPMAKSSISEAATSLASIKKIITNYALLTKNDTSKQVLENIKNQLDNCIVYCNTNSDFDSFNRAIFITKYINPLSSSLYKFQQIENIGFVNDGRPYKQSAATLFDKNGFDVNAFIPSKEFASTPAKIALGKKLFYSNMLSTNGNRNCATCHQADKAFTDGLTTSANLSGGFIKRNAPTLTYAVLQHGQFWDMRQPDLESQAGDVMANKDEMHSSLQNAVDKLNKDSNYTKQFVQAFGNKQPIKTWQLQNAIASYVRSLTAFNAPFDDYMRGNENALNAEEINGFTIFMGKAKCGSCHFVPIFNGTVPPKFVKTEGEVLGTPKTKTNKQLDDDKGRYIQHNMPQLMNGFKTPTLRNIALTAPYMHNGVYNTLEETIDFYNKGGGVGLGFKVPNQTLAPDPLNLKPTEIKALVAFMKTLTDKTE